MPSGGDESSGSASLFVLKSFKNQGGCINYRKEITMNEDRVQGNWKQFKGKVQEQWGKLTDDDLDVIAGKRDQLLGKIQERHGITKDEAEKQLSDFHGRNPTNFFERS